MPPPGPCDAKALAAGNTAHAAATAARDSRKFLRDMTISRHLIAESYGRERRRF
jgi:hypothetical protein